MRILKLGSVGPSVELLQLALNRSGCGPLSVTGIFSSATQEALSRFQKRYRLMPDGIADFSTHRALFPWYTGYTVHSVQSKDSVDTICIHYGCSPSSLLAANPGRKKTIGEVGDILIVPLPFPVIPHNVTCFSDLIRYCLLGLCARYPFLSLSEYGHSVMGKPLWTLQFGRGEKRILYTAGHHANEWICSLMLLRFIEELSLAFINQSLIFDESATDIFSRSRLIFIPAVNPDGIDLAGGELQTGERYVQARSYAKKYPQYSFPSAWKANIQGIDLNLQYPALWEKAKENKRILGICSPAPADYVGTHPLQAIESRALAAYTISLDPALVLAFHTQGEVIYGHFMDYRFPAGETLLQAFSALSGYSAEETPYASSFAGFKDWFIQDFQKPAFTIEAGTGNNPLPLQQLEKIYTDNLGILVRSAVFSV